MPLLVLVAAWATVLATPARAPAHSRATVLTGADVVARLGAGAFVERDVRITGLNLRDVKVTHPFECIDCTFAGGIEAKDAIFERRVDLSGSVFAGPVDMQGALFNGPASFRAPARFAGPAGFELAKFAGLTSFEGAEFGREASFTLVRFGGDAIFALGSFHGAARFDRSTFEAAADFSRRTFLDEAGFRGVELGAGADFGRARFALEATFDGARFGRDVTFLSAHFTDGISIVDVRAEGAIDLSVVHVTGTLDIEDTTAGAVLVRSPTIDADGELYFRNVGTPDFALDLEAIDHVTSDRRETLGLIEASAKTRGDLALANDAKYRLNVLRSRTLAWPARVGDVVFYRWIAGYLLRPFHPLLTLVALALLVSLIRSRLAPPPAAGTDAAPGAPAVARPRRGRRRRVDWTAMRAGAARVGHELLDTLALIWPGGGPKEGSRRFEAVVYRVLFVCMLFGFANSNPTLRQMLDALT